MCELCTTTGQFLPIIGPIVCAIVTFVGSLLSAAGFKRTKKKIADKLSEHTKEK